WCVIPAPLMFIQQLTTLIRRSTRTSECQLVPYTGSIAGHICVLAGGGEDAVCREAAIRRRDLHPRSALALPVDADRRLRRFRAGLQAFGESVVWRSLAALRRH